MKKFLFIDTNIFIQCSFLEIEDGDTGQSLEKLIPLLEGDTYLLLPEVTKLEIIQGLESKREKINIEINKIKGESKQYNGLGKKISKDINDKITELFEERLKNYEEVGNKIKEIFESKNTIFLPLKTEHIIEAYKFFLTKKRPFTQKNIGTTKQEESQFFSPTIQSDCLNIIAIQDYLKDNINDEFYFCCGDGDFFEDVNKKTVLHKDITNFLNVTDFNKNLGFLLKSKFGVNFSKEDIKRFDYLNSIEDSLAEAITEENNISKSSGSLVGETKKTIQNN